MGWYNNHVDVSEMLGQTFSRVLADNESVTFENDKVRYVLYHEQDCCESVVVEEIIGDIEDLENWPLLIAREDHDADGKGAALSMRVLGAGRIGSSPAREVLEFMVTKARWTHASL